MSVIRWVFKDTKTNATVVLPLNPNEMSTPTFQRNIEYAWTSQLQRLRLVDAGAATPVEWSFGGVIRNHAHYELLLEWAKLSNILRVTDHLGRTFEIIMQKFDPVEKRPTPTNAWRADYTMSCLLLKEVT